MREVDEDAELSEDFPRRYRRSSPGAKKKKNGRHAVCHPPLQRVSEKSTLEAPILLGSAPESDTVQQRLLATEQVLLGAQQSVESGDRKRWPVFQGMPDEHAPAVHVATAKAWHRSNARCSF